MLSQLMKDNYNDDGNGSHRQKRQPSLQESRSAVKEGDDEL